MSDIQDLPERDPAKVQELSNVVREMATGMRAADVIKALASVITTVICDTSRSRETAQAIIASVGDEMLIAVNQAERPGWPPSRQQQKRYCLAHLIRDAQYAIDAGDSAFAPGLRKLLPPEPTWFDGRL